MRNHSIKLHRAIKLYSGFKGANTLTAIMEQIPCQLIDGLNSYQLAAVMQAINNGKSSAGAEMIDADAVYINKLGRTIEWEQKQGKLIPHFVED